MLANDNSDDQLSKSDETLQNNDELKSMQDVRKLDKNGLLQYIEKLHQIINKTRKGLENCQRTIKNMLKHKTSTTKFTANVEDAVKNDADLKDNPTKQIEEISASAAFSFVDEMRQVAEQAQTLNNFVYEPISGLYYDPKSGYYYNAEYGLYYDGNTGCYYSYNQTKNSYELHSQAQLQNNVATGNNSDYDNNDDTDEVEFDEYGGVITNKQMLKEIKAQKKQAKQQHCNRKKKFKKTASNTNRKNKKSKFDKTIRRKKKKYCKPTVNSDSSGNKDICDSDSKHIKTKQHRTREDGELSESGSADSSISSNNSSNESDCTNYISSDTEVPIFKTVGHFQDIAKKYPPSLRIIVQETNMEGIKIGSLYMITFKGGTLGREGTHDVIIPDVNVSKTHLKFYYDTKKRIYKCIDLGSRNGTLLNGARMSSTKIQSDAQDLVHGSIIQIGQTKLLCHVHEGNSTCGLCEPGLLIEAQRLENRASTPILLTHKEQLKKLQKKYGLENEKFLEVKNNIGNYNDRAATRRIKVGSSTDKEKTEVSCINTEISSSNKGFKMLSKLGWQKGEALGKTNTNNGLLEPINVVSNDGKIGLGCDPAVSYTAAAKLIDKKKMVNLKITQERYKRADIHVDLDDSD